jgi:hypothetical protein
MKKLLPVLLILCILCLSGCSILKDLQSGMQAAAAHAEEFCSALAKDDLASAEGYLHPNATPKGKDLPAFLAKLEQNHGIDFSDGVAFKSRTDFSSTYYDSSYGGSVHECTYQAVVGETTVKLFFVVVENDSGYGIYSFGISK